MKIVEYNEKYVEEMIDLYIDMLAKDGEKWTRENARYHLVDLGLKNVEKYSWFLIDDKENLIGGLFAGEFPVWDGMTLELNFVAVKDEYRGKGYGKLLMKHLLDNINKEEFFGFALKADSEKEFPFGWYKKIGLKPISWVELYAEFDEINLD